MKSDRIFGLVVIIGALAFIAGALQIQTSFLSDPVGPRAFPLMIGVAAAICGAVMMLAPDAEPHWPDARAWAGIAAAAALLVGYAYALSPLGFLLSTAIAAAGISWLIAANLTRALLTGACLSALLYVVFKYGLGLGLFALPRALHG